MRLIDADALKAKIESADVDGTIANYCRRVMVNCLDSDAPTIISIPLEWLIDKELNGERELSYSAWRVLSEWRQEQAEQEANGDA